MEYKTTELKALKVAELKSICAKLGLSTMGKKEELIKNILDNKSKSQESKPTLANGSTKKVDSDLIDLSKGDDLKDLGITDVDHSGLNSDGLTDLLDEPHELKDALQEPELTDSQVETLLLDDSKPVSETKKLALNSKIDEEEKIRRRIEKFGPVKGLEPKKTTAVKNSVVAGEVNEKSHKKEESFNEPKKTKSSIAPVTEVGCQLAASRSAVSSIDHEERLRLRAARFGIATSASSKRTVPEKTNTKNGTITNKSSMAITAENQEKLDARAKRFKTEQSAPLAQASSTSLEDAEKLAKRAERFGVKKL